MTRFLLTLKSVHNSLEAMHTHTWGSTLRARQEEHPLGSSTCPGMRKGTDQLPFKAVLNRELIYAEELRKDDGMLCTCLMSLPLEEDIIVVPLHALGCDLFVLLQQPADGIAQSSVQTTFSIKSVCLTLCSC